MPDKNIYGGSEKDYSGILSKSSSRPTEMFEAAARPQVKEKIQKDIRQEQKKVFIQEKEPKKIQEKEPKKVTPLSWMDDKQVPIAPKEKISWLQTPSKYSPDTIKAPFLKTGSVFETAAYFWQKNWPGAVASVEQTRKEWILPTDSKFVQKLKDIVITTLAGGRQTAHTAIQTGISMTLENAGAVIAPTVASGNDLFRTVLKMDEYSAEQKEDLMDNLYDHTVYGTMALLESTGFRGFKAMNPFPSVLGDFPIKWSTNLAKSKIQFEFNNAINSVNKVFNSKKAKNQINPNSIRDMNDFVVNQAIVNPIVKKDIQALVIKTFEQQQAPKIGNIAANQIANRLREGSGIRVVAPLKSVSAAVTPKEFLPLEEKGPFFNPIQETIYDLPEIVSVEALKEKVSTKKNLRVAEAIGLNDFIAELDAGNRQTISRTEIENYVNNNPFDITVKVSNISSVLPKDRIIYEDALSATVELYDSNRTIVSDVLYSKQDIIERAGETFVHASENAVSGETYSGGERAMESAKALADFKDKQEGAFSGFLDGMAEGYFTSIREGMLQEVTEFEPVQSSYENFKIGKFGIVDNLPNTWGTGFLSHKVTTITDLKKSIMRGLGYVHDKVGNDMAWRPIEYGELMTEDWKQKQINWSNELLNNLYDREVSQGDIEGIGIEEGGHPYLTEEYNHQRLLLDPLENIDAMNVGKFNLGAYEMVETHLDTILPKLQANDLPEWPSFINAIEKNYSHSIDGGRRIDFNSAVDLIKENKNTIAKLKENAKKADLIDSDIKQVTDSIFYEYETIAPKWNTEKTYNLETDKADVFMNFKVTTNKLKKVATFGDSHFPDQNLLGWILGTEKIIKGGVFNGKKNWIWEEAQSSNPFPGTPWYGPWTMEPITKRMNLETKVIKPTLHGIEGTTRLQTITGNNIIKRIEKITPRPVFDKIEGGERFVTDKQVLSIPDMALQEVVNYESGVAIKKASGKYKKGLAPLVSQAPTKADYILQEYVDIGDNMLVSVDNILDLHSPIHIVYNAKGTPVNFYQILDGELFFNVIGANKVRIFNEKFNTYQDSETTFDTIEAKKARVADDIVKANIFDVRQKTQQRFSNPTEFIKALDLHLIDKSSTNARTLMGKGGFLGKADWYRKLALSGLRYAYDRGMDFITIPSADTMTKKKGGNIGDFYGITLPNVFIKWGLGVSRQHLLDMGVNVPENADPSEWLRRHYGDSEATVIDLRDKDKVKEILQNIHEPVASLDKDLYQQTNELFSRLA